MSSFKRTYRRNSKKAVSAMLAAAICLSGSAAVFADEPAESSANLGTGTNITNTSNTAFSLFSDVQNGFWAEKYIYKLAAEGIIVGDAGKFRPSDSVTQQEAITMAIRFMNLSAEVGSGDTVPAELQISGYAKPYVELALKKNLIDKDEELAILKEKESWGQKKASREWVAKVLIRALGKDEEAKALGTAATGFADHDKITSSVRGYVNLAAKLDITKGIEGNKFDPQGNVTRAQIATFFGKGAEHLDANYSNVYEGIVTELTDSKLTLYVDNQLKSFVLDNRSVYFTKDSQLKISKQDLKPYTKVLAIDKIGSAAYVEIIDGNQQLESTEGTLLRILNGNRILMLVNNDSVEYTFDDTTAFLDQNGNKVAASSLTPESTIIVQRETYTAARKPVLVQVKSALVSKSGTGTIESVDVTGKKITIRDTSGTVETYAVDETTILLYQSQKLNSLSELQANSAIKYSVKNSVLDSLEVTQSIERTVKGTLLGLDQNGRLLTYSNASGYPEVKLLAEKPEIIVGGIKDATFDDLIADLNGGDKVELTLDAEERVTKIVVQGRQSEQMPAATVVNYDSKSKTLTVLDANAKPHVFVLDEKTKVEYNSNQPTLAGMESVLNKDRKINVTYIGSRALSVQMIYKYEGTFVSVNTAEKKITLLTSDNKTIALPYQGTAPTIELYGKSATLSDVKVGDPVVAMLSTNQDAVQTLAVKSSAQFVVSSVDTSYSRIRAVNSNNGLTESFYVDQAILTDENGNPIRVNNIQSGQTINVAFHGHKAVSLQVVKLTLGSVQNIDASTLTVKTFTGGTESFPLSGSVKVVRGTSVTTGTGGLASADRVEVRKDSDGTLIVKVLTSLERKFSRYDASARELVVKRATIADDKYRFFVNADTYVHQGDTTISVQSLKDDDKIVLYFNGDRLVEIEKQ
ncbi:S-layer homology domain-containing protein [Paenibacillus woosongensis]|uniref:S-layer homology domain-containing protein n=1 Tax=Paenibacillus woosongensis TaxID=307580 RepID=A0AA95I053_9BACL|nr:S-layer homology domain-containing protein [Paenibacillus woosongensis]WHX47301.1 S-layer homology domain-containing protein [Paenibacillus woosongensis]